MDSRAQLGASGRIARFFERAQLTPLLALTALLLGVFAVLVTPREEEPQINVTMANVFVPFPGASVADVEQLIAVPAEQVISQIAGVEHTMSVSRPGLAVLTVQFKVGVPRTEALVRLNDAVSANADWLPSGLGAMPPIVKPKGIDDVPIVAITLHAPEQSARDLERVAVSIEAELKRVSGTREVRTIGGPGRAIVVELDPTRMAASGVTVSELARVLRTSNEGAPIGDLLQENRAVQLEAGPFFRHADDLADVIVSTRAGRPVFLRDVATIRDGSLPASQYVWHGIAGKAAREETAVTITVTKKPGENAIEVARAIDLRLDTLRNAVIPADVSVEVVRNYGETANDKARALITKLLFATVSVVALVFVALGRREAAIVGVAVLLTLAATLFASWAWGFTLNRVSLFALIFSIGILVDDAIVVVENIHRHRALFPEKSLTELIPSAVDEVGSPTILATFTVIAALLPMAFVSGLMGPYMSPIPINASMGMLISLAIAFVVTPWMAARWMRPGHAAGTDHASRFAPLLQRTFTRLFNPLLDDTTGQRNRRKLGLGVMALIAVSVLLPVVGLVQLKMLPFDNKSELQVVVDMPVGTPVEKTAAVLRELGALLAKQSEVLNYQAYAGTAAPINFNGLVRQYYLRRAGNMGDIQVNLVDKAHRHEKSHAIAMRLRPALQALGTPLGANVKVIEVPPGPPVLAPIVAEIYGPEAEGRRDLARAVRKVFSRTDGVTDVDDTTIAEAPRLLINIDRRKAALQGVSQQEIVQTLGTAISGLPATYLRDASKYAVPVTLQLAPERHGDLDALLALRVRTERGQLIPISELMNIVDSTREQPRFRKDLLPVEYVMGDMAGKIDSPLYGMFAMRKNVVALPTANGGEVREYFIRTPEDALRNYAIKWDGEWQITYETFRDMGAAYAVGLVLIYLLVVAQFGSYLTPLIIMAPIPLTIIGVMPGHALLGAQFTATSMIGMIALAGIIVRNSILLVDFIELEVKRGAELKRAIVDATIARAQPIALTGVAAMLGALFILDDPIFNGLAISLIFGIFVSTLLTLVVIPLLYFVAYQRTSCPTPSPQGEIT
ncbi:MAG: efflux RND transporter permease subunit [Burkholderiales bacterium]